MLPLFKYIAKVRIFSLSPNLCQKITGQITKTDTPKGVCRNEILGIGCVTCINYTQYAIDKGILSMSDDEDIQCPSYELFAI